MTTAANPSIPPAASLPRLEAQAFDFCRDAEIAAPLDIAWQALLLQLGEESQMPGGKPFPMKLEPWPGGRWYRDLGKSDGHFWGHVQVIKPPALLEINGPLFMSFPAVNHLQYRLAAHGPVTRLTLTHRAFGNLPREFVERGMDEGWTYWMTRIQEIAARLAAGRGG